MAYTVLARRYRSQDFDSVVGQEPIATTLRSAIATGRVAHAYLFCGTRGVGKTSMARIFAKALNSTEADAPLSDEVVRAIMTGQDQDVIEIDAASNRGVDEARELISNSIYRPMRGPYKVYIIDEVHMLTREAFNALLKTMEEPPEHVKFILCTTEAHKVPPTIQSRCQRFDFRDIPSTKIADHLTSVLVQEKIEAEPALVQLVARLGNGSMRDALSLLDRLLASGQTPLTMTLLEHLLGLPERDIVTGFIEALASGDAATALTSTDELLNRGTGMDLFLETLLDRLRDLMVLAACGSKTELVNLQPEERQTESQLASKFDDAGLSHLIAVCESVHRLLRSSAAPRAMLDAAIVRMAHLERFALASAVVVKTNAQLGAPQTQARTNVEPKPVPASGGGGQGSGGGGGSSGGKG